MDYAVKCGTVDASAASLSLPACKTMYGGKRIAAGDRLFIFTGHAGFVAAGVVASARAVPRRAGVERQTPRVDLAVVAVAPARRPLDRAALQAFTDWHDGRPETELNFKFYRQATDKVVGLSEAAARLLEARL